MGESADTGAAAPTGFGGALGTATVGELTVGAGSVGLGASAAPSSPLPLGPLKAGDGGGTVFLSGSGGRNCSGVRGRSGVTPSEFLGRISGVIMTTSSVR